MSIIDVVGFGAGLFLFYLGYLSGPLQWRMARKAILVIERDLGAANIDPTELQNMRQYASSTPLFSPVSIVFFILGALSCFPLANTLLTWEYSEKTGVIQLHKQKTENDNLAQLAEFGDTQNYEPLSPSVQATLNKAMTDQAEPHLAFDNVSEARIWLTAMSSRLEKTIPDRVAREEFLVTVHYEAKRAGLDPQLVLALIDKLSQFRKFAVSKNGARGYMQIMPFWVKLIGTTEHNLFNLRTNLRYGCVILRHYLDIENGNLSRALGRYNGSLGKSEFPNEILEKWHSKWRYSAAN